MRGRNLTGVMMMVLVLFATTPGAYAADDQKPATAVVQGLQNALLEVMKRGAQLDTNARFAELDPVITQAHDFDYVTPRVFGEDWDKLSAEQKKTVLDLYRRASIMAFVQQFNAYHGEQFQILDEKETARGSRVVRTVMRLPTGESVSFEYLLHEADGKWRIINTAFDGVSGMSMDRTRYQPLLQERGADALIAQLRKAASGQL